MARILSHFTLHNSAAWFCRNGQWPRSVYIKLSSARKMWELLYIIIHSCLLFSIFLLFSLRRWTAGRTLRLCCFQYTVLIYECVENKEKQTRGRSQKIAMSEYVAKAAATIKCGFLSHIHWLLAEKWATTAYKIWRINKEIVQRKINEPNESFKFRV